MAKANDELDIDWKDGTYRGFQIQKVNNFERQTRPNVRTVVKYSIEFCGTNVYFTTQADTKAFIDSIKESKGW